MDKARADLLLVAGGDDAMWPSLRFAEQLARRRLLGRSDGASDHPSRRFYHRLRFPGESLAPASPRFRYGGTPEADARLGTVAWPHVLDALRNGN